MSSRAVAAFGLMMLAAASPAWAACSTALSGLSSPGQLSFGTSAPPPAPGIPPVNQTGFEYDLSAALAQAMCLKPAYTVLAFAGLFPGLEAHKFDGAIAGIGITPQREQSFAFVPYFLGGIRLMVRKDSKIYVDDEKGVCGHSIAVLAGSVEAHDIDKVKDTCPPGKPMDVRILPSNNEIVEQLRKGTIQIAFLDWAPVADIVARSQGDFAIGSPILSGDGPGTPRHRVGIMIRKDDNELKAALTQALKSLQDNGAYAKLLEKWGLQEGDIRKSS